MIQNERHETQKEFYSGLIVELIDNTVDAPIGVTVANTPRNLVTPAHHDRIKLTLVNAATGAPRSGIGLYLTPTKRKRMSKGEPTNYMLQGLCRMCKKKTTYMCSVCHYSPDITDDGWICHSQHHRDCFARHVDQKHSTFT